MTTDYVGKARYVLDNIGPDCTAEDVAAYQDWLSNDGPRYLLAEIDMLRATVWAGNSLRGERRSALKVLVRVVVAAIELTCEGSVLADAMDELRSTLMVLGVSGEELKSVGI